MGFRRYPIRSGILPALVLVRIFVEIDNMMYNLSGGGEYTAYSSTIKVW